MAHRHRRYGTRTPGDELRDARLEVPDTLWTYLLALAKRTLVPATSASRERGAGGGDYND